MPPHVPTPPTDCGSAPRLKTGLTTETGPTTGDRTNDWRPDQRLETGLTTADSPTDDGRLTTND